MATIKEVAVKAGVSVTTVSRTLNNRGYISQEMRKKINDAMAELNYHPNEVARSLSRQRTRIVGVLVPEIDNPFFSEVVAELSGLLSQRGYKMMLFSARGGEEEALEYINMLRANQVDGIIVALRGQAIEAELSDDLPVVSFERLRTGKLPTVMCDNLEGGRMAAKELLECGCRHPVMVGSRHTAQNFPAFDRFTGFAEIIREVGLPVHICEAHEENYSGNYTQLAQSVIQRYPDVDGIFCTSDTIAAYIEQEAMRIGKRIPEDLKLIGFNDNRLAAMCAVPLTSIRQPVHEMCEVAVNCLLSQIHKELIAIDMRFPVTIHRRASTRGY